MHRYKDYFPEIIYLILFISIGLIPNYGALDRIATQWFYLSVLNSLGLSIFLFDKKYDSTNYKVILKFKPLLILILFVIWGLISYVYALNSSEVIVKTIRWIQIPVSLFIILLLIESNRLVYINLIIYLITIILIVELYFSYSTYFDITKYTSYNFSFANIIKGATGNKNINAASILIKIPFVILILYRLKPIIFKIFLGLVIASSSYLVLILSSRAAIISLIIITLFIIIKFILSLVSNNYKIKNLSFLIIVFAITLPIIFFSIKFSSVNTASIANRVSTINIEDTSTQQRLRYYKHSLTQIMNNPIIGVGLGNWKIKSIDYDKENIEGYTIPYHTHNDFLEIGTELGFIGVLLYLMIFLIPFYFLIKKKKSNDDINLNTVILLSGIVYFIDANLNFPHARPVMQIPFILIISFFYYQLKNYKENGG